VEVERQTGRTRYALLQDAMRLLLRDRAAITPQDREVTA